MFKFIKEIIASIKEGVAEGIAEGKEEMIKEKESEDPYRESKNKIHDIPAIESFGTALGAPFRVVVFGNWYTLFGFTEEDEHYPLHLYSFGDYQELEEKKKEFQTLMSRDFDITDRNSCLAMLSSYFKLIGVEFPGDLAEINHESHPIDEKMWDLSKEGATALAISVMSHIVTASADLKYLNKQESLRMLEKLKEYAVQNFSNWEDYGEKFILGEKNVGLNNPIGRSMLTKYVNYLKTKKGSPWNNIEWKK